MKDARVVARVDVDGDHRADRVGFTGDDEACTNVLFAHVRSGYLGTMVPAEGPTTAYAVRLPGRAGALLVADSRAQSGRQLRLYVADGPHLKELRVGGRPLVPGIPTEGTHPLSVQCREEGLVVVEAIAHEPPGVLAAWDIRETTYALEDGIVASDEVEVADNVLPDQLAGRFPQLVRHTMFAGCRV